MTIDSKAASLRAREFKERFVLPLDQLWKEFDSMQTSVPPTFRGAALAFRQNIESALTVATIPYIMAYTAVVRTRLNSLSIAERIRAQTAIEDGEPEEDALRKASLKASARLEEELKDTEAHKRMGDQVVGDLLELVEQPEFDAASYELLLETLVMIWGAFEILATDIVRVVLNADPSTAQKLFSDQDAEKHFPSRGVSIEDLASHDFNVAASMGDLLLTDRHLESLPLIKAVLNAISEKESLREHLSNPDLWLLGQRRNLIVHRRGVIDAAYLKKTSDKGVVGSRVTIGSDYVEASFVLVVGLAVEILKGLEHTVGTNISAKLAEIARHTGSTS